jgi:hypothetical protein
VARANAIGAQLQSIEAQVGQELGMGGPGGQPGGQPQLDDRQRTQILQRSYELLKSGQASIDEINAELGPLGLGTIDHWLSTDELKNMGKRGLQRRNDAPAGKAAPAGRGTIRSGGANPHNKFVAKPGSRERVINPEWEKWERNNDGKSGSW